MGIESLESLNLIVTSVDFAPAYYLSGKVDATISVGTPGVGIPDGFERVPLRLRLEMEDLYEVKEIHKYQTQGRRAPNESDVRRIVVFSRKLKGDETVLVHCHAGISRSSAAAWILLYILEGPGSEHVTLNHLLGVRPQAYPNKILMAYADRVLGARFLEAMNTSLGGLYLP